MELTLDLSTVAIAEHAHDGHLDFDQLGRLVFDWEDRPTWACGPTAMLDAVEKVWDDAGLRDGLHMEVHHRPYRQGRRGWHGHLFDFRQAHRNRRSHFAFRGRLQMPFGCRMGICQTCVLPVESGHIRDFRSGDEHGEGDRINTCISTASGDCTIKG